MVLYSSIVVSGSYDPLFVTGAGNGSQYVESKQMVDEIIFRYCHALYIWRHLDSATEPFRMDVSSHH